VSRRAHAEGWQYSFQPGCGGARYKCLQCGHAFMGDPGPTTTRGGQPRPNACSKCGSMYVKWVNYESWRKKHPLPPLIEVDG
jgi:DNA-directed RNA polymerase subunit RPC12/RpoP